MKQKLAAILITLSLFNLTACNVNPDLADNHFTGNAIGTAVGAGVAGFAVGLLGAPKPVTLLAALTGAGIGYYMTTLRFDAGGVLHAGGLVYSEGDMLTIEISTYQLFDVDSSDLLPQADTILASVAAILLRYPNENILISGNTSGFGTDQHEIEISTAQAKQVAGFLWAHGINNFTEGTIRERKLTYVGYGNRFPIASNITAQGIMQNSRIQITAYPSILPFTNGHYRALANVGAVDDHTVLETPRLKTSAE